jgi:hypothetical protein
MKVNLPYELYKIYAELASRYYAFRDRNKSNPPPLVCQICGKGNHIERFCPNAARMGFIKLEKKKDGRA